MNKPISLSIFFPAYNEEANLRPTIVKTLGVLKKIPQIKKYEITIIDDGSTDNTKKVAEQLALEYPFVRTISHKTNQGYGSALISGLRSAKHEYVFFTDADLQFDIDELTKLLEHIPEYKIVIGYRAPRRDPFMRILNAYGWNVLNRIFFGLKVRDIDCAFKLFEQEVLADLPLKSRGAMLSAEILIRLQRKGIKFKEVPVTHLPRKAGSPTGAKPSVIIRALREMFLLYRGELGDITHRQIFKFAAVGVLNTAVDVFSYFGLSRSGDLFGSIFSTHLVLTKVVSFLLGSVCSFTLNRAWTFRKAGHVKFEELVRFYSTVGVSVLINAVSMQTFLSVLHLYDLTALAGATLITFIWNFTLSKFWVFGETHRRTKDGKTANAKSELITERQ